MRKSLTLKTKPNQTKETDQQNEIMNSLEHKIEIDSIKIEIDSIKKTQTEVKLEIKI